MTPNTLILIILFFYLILDIFRGITLVTTNLVPSDWDQIFVTVTASALVEAPLGSRETSGPIPSLPFPIG